MRNYCFISVLFLFFLSSVHEAIGQNTNASTIDVNNLSDLQIQRIMQEIQSRGLTEDQAISLAKARGASQIQIDQLLNRIQQQPVNSSAPISGSTGISQQVSSDNLYSKPRMNLNIPEKTK